MAVSAISTAAPLAEPSCIRLPFARDYWPWGWKRIKAAVRVPPTTRSFPVSGVLYTTLDAPVFGGFASRHYYCAAISLALVARHCLVLIEE